MEIIITKDYAEMSQQAAQIIADQVLAKPNSVLGLATGGTPVGTYQELVRMHREGILDFSKVVTFNLDEYVGLPKTHEQSYYYFMHDKLFNHINIPPESVHVPDGMAEDIEAFCEWYEDRIDEAGGIDLQLLGIGGDGHIAFNEPVSSLGSRTRLKTLTEETIADNARFFDKKEDVPRYAITMGVGTILEAEHCLLIANGAQKAKIVAALIEGPVTAMVTASALQLHPRTTIILDEEAAADLKLKDYYHWVWSQKNGHS
jgi:glucosamine-6-phosphate deaminase